MLESQKTLFTRVRKQKRMLSLRKQFENLQIVLAGTIKAFSLMVEMRDPYTAAHQQSVAELACAIAEEMELSDEQVKWLHVAGILHDIGKISVPMEILSKPGRISEFEFSIISTHPQVGYDILKPIEFARPVAQIVLQHHERIDGSGYPFGLSGEEIFLEAKILGVADVVGAMTDHRPYRPAPGINEALDEIVKGRGTLYDEQVVDACLQLKFED